MDRSALTRYGADEHYFRKTEVEEYNFNPIPTGWRSTSPQADTRNSPSRLRTRCLHTSKRGCSDFAITGQRRVFMATERCLSTREEDVEGLETTSYRRSISGITSIV